MQWLELCGESIEDPNVYCFGGTIELHNSCRETSFAPENFAQPFTYDDDWMFEISKGGPSIPANVKQEDIPDLWKNDGEDFVLPEPSHTSVSRNQDVQVQRLANLPLAADSQQDLPVEPSSHIQDEVQSHDNRGLSLSVTSTFSSGSVVQSSSSPDNLDTKQENTGNQGSNNSLSDDFFAPNSDALIDSVLPECGEGIQILRTSYSDEKDGYAGSIFTNTLPAPGSTSPIRYSDEPVNMESHHISPNLLPEPFDCQSQDSHPGGVLKGEIQCAVGESSCTLDVQASPLEPHSRSSASKCATPDHLQDLSSCPTSEIESASNHFIACNIVKESFAVEENAHHSETDSCRTALQTHVVSPHPSIPDSVSLPENFKGLLLRDAQNCCGTDQNLYPSAAPSSHTSNVGCSATLHTSQVPSSAVPNVDSLVFPLQPAHATLSNMAFNVPSTGSNQFVRPNLGDIEDRGLKQSNDSYSFPNVDSVLDKYKINRRPGWWKSLLSSEARGQLEPQRSYLEHDTAANVYAEPKPYHGLGFSSPGLNPIVTAKMPVNAHRIYENITKLEETKNGNSISCGEALPADDRHSPYQASNNRAVPRKKHLDKETERIAQIMSHNNEEQ